MRSRPIDTAELRRRAFGVVAAKRGACGVPYTSKNLGKAVNERLFSGRGFGLCWDEGENRRFWARGKANAQYSKTAAREKLKATELYREEAEVD